MENLAYSRNWKKWKKEIKELKEQQLQIDNIIISDTEINNNVTVEAIEQNNEDLEDEQEMTIVNNDFKKSDIIWKRNVLKMRLARN
ncbi:Uncharacterized protein APZ42_011845 [Daphnia magna]|uniref:Uncharacterized protein n=1 Tax=Daphnia magna TaxID=35525 RepID=A0A162SGD8_9CRUS|nr:Uncharacterized protein APZ42_011845 [Daphnia magna]